MPNNPFQVRWEQNARHLSPTLQPLISRLRPVLNALMDLHDKQRIIIAIDGPCGSGKTTLASVLCQLIDAPCIHMDDFHVPHRDKTEERLSQPGGNSDRERLLCEALLPWLSRGQTIYHPYDCRNDCPGPAIQLNDAPCLVLEGSYSHHPELAAYADLLVFVQVERDEQLRRLERRCPEKLPMFLSRWIPLEERYYAAFQLPEPRSIILRNHSVQAM